MDRKSARKYRELGQLPEEARKPRTWRTWPDALAEVWPAVVPLAGGRGHVDDPFEEFSLLEMGHSVVAALELLARQPIAVLQQRLTRSLGKRCCHDILLPHA